jgi:hypothetical protein
MSVAARRPRQRGQPVAGAAFPLVIGSLWLDLAVEGNRPVVPMSVRFNGHLWGG